MREEDPESGGGSSLSGPSLVGTVLGRYLLVRLLGVGGMGSVYEATHQDLGRRAAIKTLHERYGSEREARQRFLQEGQAAARIRHPNVADVYDVGIEGERPYLVMELLEGENLARLIQREGPLSVQRAADLLVPVVAAVAAAHDQQVLHRDLKPENIFLCSERQAPEPKVVDFGISKLRDAGTGPALTESGILLGTPHYMSPEQAQGARDMDARSDQYSLGVILYECVTGCRPLEGVPLYALLQRTVQGDFPSPRQLLPSLPGEFEALILKTMARRAEGRFATTRALGTALLPFASERIRNDYAHELAGDARPRVLSSAPPVVIRAAGERQGETTSDLPEPTLQPRGQVAHASERQAPRQLASRRRRWWLPAAALVAGLVSVTAWRVGHSDRFWQNPIASGRFEHLADFDGIEQAAALSRDGRFVAFLSDRDGPMDVWLTQVGTGQFVNLTHGKFQELINPMVRTLGFSPDGTLVTFWTRKPDGPSPNNISVWAVPILGGQPQLYLEGVSEFDWSNDATQVVYHSSLPGDPTFVKDRDSAAQGRSIFRAPPGLHAHFQTWSPARDFIYFVQGTLPDAMDIWRMRPNGGSAEQLTQHHSRVSYPIVWNEQTLMYLATDAEGFGPWLYGMDVERRIPHRISTGVDSYTSLAASTDGRRLVATLANPKETLWRVTLADTPVDASAVTRISLATGRGSSPRLGPGYLLYVSSKGSSEGIWKLADGMTSELWSAAGVHVLDGPAIAPDGQRIAFSIEQGARTRLYVMRVDGTDARVVTEALQLKGAPAWAPDGQSITSAAVAGDAPQLFQIPLDGRPPTPLVQNYSIDPVWDPEGRFIVYSGPDLGTRFSLKAVTANGSPYALPDLTMTRGARRVCFLRGRRALVVLRGEIQHKDLWLIDLETGNERQLTNLARDFDVRDFDVSPDGQEIVLDRVQELSDIVLIELPSED